MRHSFRTHLYHTLRQELVTPKKDVSLLHQYWISTYFAFTLTHGIRKLTNLTSVWEKPPTSPCLVVLSLAWIQSHKDALKKMLTPGPAPSDAHWLCLERMRGSVFLNLPRWFKGGGKAASHCCSSTPVFSRCTNRLQALKGRAGSTTQVSVML